MLKDYKLILAGGMKDEDKEYVENLKKIAASDPSIEFKVNVSYDELLKLYKSAQIFWHFSGFYINKVMYPELV